MNSNSALIQYRDKGLKPHQAALVDDFLTSAMPVRRLLVAGPGYGKTIAAVCAMKEIAARNLNCRILVIGPRALTSFYGFQFTQAVPTAQVIDTNRRGIREMESEKHGQPIWPAPCLVFINVDLAAQDDVLVHLCSVPWDLVIAEEVQLFGRARSILLNTILNNESFMRVLLVTTTPETKLLSALPKQIQRIKWGLTLKDWDGQSLFKRKPVQLVTVLYRRSQDEEEVAHQLIQLLDELTQHPAGQMIKRVLLKQASSSMLALERTLRLLRNTLAHSPSELVMPHFAEHALNMEGWPINDADLEASMANVNCSWVNKSKALVLLEGILEKIESVANDKKREALEALLHRLENDTAATVLRVCIFCTSRLTANYLHTVFVEQGKKVWLLTTRYPGHEIFQTLKSFSKEGGILIATVAALQGFELRQAQAFVHYDPAPSELDMKVRLSRGPSSTHYFLKDESQAIPNEGIIAPLA